MDQDILQAGLRNMEKDPKLAKLWSKLQQETNDNGEIVSQIYKHIIRYHYGIHETMYELDNRIEQLENKVFKNAKAVPTTRSQQILILYYLGFFKKNDTLSKISSNKKKAKLLSVMLNSSADNIEGDLSIVNLNESNLRTIKNYEFVQNVFKEAGLKEIVKEIETEIIKLNKAGKPK